MEDAFIPLSVLPWADEIYKQPISLTLSPLDFEVKALMGIIPTAVGIIPTAVLPRVGRGCTVNTCTGQSTTGERRRKLFSADFETMEGAAIALTAQMLGLPASELRSISNMASTRDMRPENVELALRNLGMFMSEWIKKT